MNWSSNCYFISTKIVLTVCIPRNYIGRRVITNKRIVLLRSHSHIVSYVCLIAKGVVYSKITDLEIASGIALYVNYCIQATWSSYCVIYWIITMTFYYEEERSIYGPLLGCKNCTDYHYCIITSMIILIRIPDNLSSLLCEIDKRCLLTLSHWCNLHWVKNIIRSAISWRLSKLSDIDWSGNCSNRVSLCA